MGFPRKTNGVKQRNKRTAHAGVRLETLPGTTSLGHAHVEDEEGDDGESSDATEASRSPTRNSVAELAPVFMYEELPDEVLIGGDLDLSVWSVVARDSCMLRLGGRKHQRHKTQRHSPRHPNQLMDALVAAAEDARPPATPATITRLNLHGAEHITDQALRTITSLCPNLTALDISRATNVSDVGLRHLVGSCRRLHSLRVGYVSSLRGVALSAIADCQLPLRELSLAGCPHVPSFALQRVLQGCGATLESLDLSFCDDSVTDNTLLSLSTLATNSTTRLQLLRLKGCRQVSDAGVVHLASACPSLTLLDLTRFDLAYKLNDIALLSLAEKCVLLQTLHLSGCESLTDVGISWLASGCQALTHLDVSGCAKLTDLSLRAIGEHSLRLQHLSLRNCTSVSDFGLRHLARGCPELAYLDVSGLILLSDPPPGTPAATVGLSSVASQCTKLHHLDLSRCSSIGDATLHALAIHACPQLTVLHLSGCSRVSSRGVREILSRYANQLTVLTLHDCQRIDDHAFSTPSSHLPLLLPRLTVLKMRHCDALTDATARVIARANAPLKELDLSGCKRLSDMAILALTEAATTATSLRYLWLQELVEITETALSWLAEKCPTLLLLDLTGCSKIRAFSLQALSSCWKFTHYRRSFKGLKPIHRAEDRLCIEEYGACWRAAIRIQSLFRARVARREAALRREEKLREWVATRLQSVFRGRQARRMAIVRRMQFNKETQAARRIQTRYRQRLARAEAARMRIKRWEEQKDSASRCVQLAWRRKKLREKLSVREMQRLKQERRVEAAATMLQRVWRGRQARSRFSVLRLARQAHDAEQREAANKMQNLFRQRAARREAQAKRAQKKQHQREEEQAALRVQRHFRRRRAQLELNKRVRERRHMSVAATCIQRKWRAKKKSVAAQITMLALRNKRQYDAAVKLQAAWKRKKGRDAMRLLKLLQDAQRQHELMAVVRVQTAWRGRAARREAATRKQANMERVLRQVRLENRSAALVQAHFRGRRGRAQYRALVLQRKQQRWKEILHPDTGKPFYYNKETGEVRFRRPQDVLDLLPKPPCDNCVPPDVSIAHVECQDCGELYCNECWRHVHKGGRRKGHAFRVLYDYYGKRVDYGDGEFPSRWPSEIHQDELDGWALRTFPLRAPVETRGAWEKYANDDGSVWFYNKETETNSYAQPPEWDGTTLAQNHKPTADQEAVEREDASGWAKYIDDASGYAYYYNSNTGESTYTRPLAFLTPRVADSQAAVERSADGWAKYVDTGSGYTYYYNELTGESTYTRPTTFLTPRRGQASVEAASVDGWAKYFDDATRVYYYYNAWTRTSTFERPPQFATPRADATATTASMQCDRLVVFVDERSGRTYAYDAQTTECRAVIGMGGATARGPAHATGYR